MFVLEKCCALSWKCVYSAWKWNESGFRPPLCTYRLNWARRTSWGWWDDWDDTVLQTQDSKFEPWRSEAEHATSRSRRLPTILAFTRGWGRNIFVSFKPPRPGTEPRTLAWKAAVLTTTLGPPPVFSLKHLSLLGILVKNSPSTLATAGERYILPVLLTIGEGTLMATLSSYHISVMLKLLIQCHTYGSLSLVGIFLLFKAGNEWKIFVF